MKPVYILYLSLWICFSACKKDAALVYDPSLKSGLSVEFDHIAGSSDLQLNTAHYINAAGEDFTVSKLRYYLSNFTFTSADGTEYAVPQDSCYFLIDESDESTHEYVLQVPEGEYRSIHFLLGVDSLRNTMDIGRRTGVLDPRSTGGDMYWGWNSGYIFFKMEGDYAASGTSGNYMYHIGGFGGMSYPTINNLKTITLDLTARGMPKVKTGLEPNIHLMVDILKVFNGGSNLSIAATPMVIFEDYSTTIADNYSAMFRHDHTEN